MTEPGIIQSGQELKAIAFICDDFLGRDVEDRDVLRAHVALELIRTIALGPPEGQE